MTPQLAARKQQQLAGLPARTHWFPLLQTFRERQRELRCERAAEEPLACLSRRLYNFCRVQLPRDIYRSPSLAHSAASLQLQPAPVPHTAAMPAKGRGQVDGFGGDFVSTPVKRSVSPIPRARLPTRLGGVGAGSGEEKSTVNSADTSLSLGGEPFLCFSLHICSDLARIGDWVPRDTV